MNLAVLAVLVASAVYIVALIIFLVNRAKFKEAKDIIDSSTDKYKPKMKTFHYEDTLLLKLNIKPEKVAIILWIERLLILAAIVTLFIAVRALALVAVGAVLIIVISNDAYKKVIYKSGITNISRVTNFINFFVPHINSGNSADQSFLGYIEYAKDEELMEFYENRDNPEFVIPPHLKQITDIYDIAKYNEEKGISDYTYILNELSEDMAQKQVYYNSFISRMGEIKPIMWSYYIGVPILIIVSFSQTYDFWMAGGGYIVGGILLALFAIFKFLIYRLQKKTVTVIF